MMRTRSNLEAQTLSPAALATVTGGQSTSDKNKKPSFLNKLAEDASAIGQKVVEEAFKWGGELDKIGKGSKLGGVGPGLVSPGLIPQAQQSLQRASKA